MYGTSLLIIYSEICPKCLWYNMDGFSSNNLCSIPLLLRMQEFTNM